MKNSNPSNAVQLAAELEKVKAEIALLKDENYRLRAALERMKREEEE